MLLGVIPMFCFRIFGGNRKNEETWKIWAKIGLLHRSVDLCRGEAEVH